MVIPPWIGNPFERILTPTIKHIMFHQLEMKVSVRKNPETGDLQRSEPWAKDRQTTYREWKHRQQHTSIMSSHQIRIMDQFNITDVTSRIFAPSTWRNIWWVCFFWSPSLLICKSPSTTQLFTTFGFFFQPLHILSQLRAYIPPHTYIHRVARSSKRLPMPMVNRSKVGKHQLQPKMISSETWRRFSKLPSEFHHRVVPFQEFIRKILRVDAEVERMCSAVQVSVAMSQKLQATQRDHFYHFWICHEIIMMSRHASRCCIPAALAEVIANREVLPQPKNDFGRTPWTNSSQPLIPILSSSWEKQRLCHNVDTFCDDCWSSSATRPAPRLWASGRWFMFEIRLDTCATRPSLRIQLWNRDMPSFQSDPWSP